MHSWLSSRFYKRRSSAKFAAAFTAYYAKVPSMSRQLTIVGTCKALFTHS